MAKTCRRSGGKVNYRSAKQAEVALEVIAEQKTLKRSYVKMETDYYKCPHCPYWHLTSAPQWEKRAEE